MRNRQVSTDHGMAKASKWEYISYNLFAGLVWANMPPPLLLRPSPHYLQLESTCESKIFFSYKTYF